MNAADNKMQALASRIVDVFGLTSSFVRRCDKDDMSADKTFTAFLLTGLAQEHGLLKDNCNRAVVTALHAIGMEEEEVPLYLQGEE